MVPEETLLACNVTLGGVAFPVKTFWCGLSPTFCWAAHTWWIEATDCLRCVSWCRAERFPLHRASSIFLVVRLAQYCWGSDLTHYPQRIVRCAGVVASCWTGLLVHPMLVSWLRLGSQTRNGSFRVVFCRCWETSRQNSGPLPVVIFQVAFRMPGTWTICALNMCHSLGAALTCLASVLGHLRLGGLSPKSVISSTVLFTIAPQWALHLCLLSISSLYSLCWWQPDPTGYGRGSSLWEARSRPGCQGPQRKCAGYLSTTSWKLKLSGSRKNRVIREMEMRKKK